MSDDYESLPAGFSFTSHMLAGALAGMTEHGVMYPIDTIKTRLQIIGAPGNSSTRSLLGSFRNVMATDGTVISIFVLTEGIGSLWKGLWSLLVGVGPAHALYFATYEEVKQRLIKEEDVDTQSVKYVISTAFAGAFATAVADAFMNPFDGKAAYL